MLAGLGAGCLPSSDAPVDDRNDTKTIDGSVGARGDATAGDETNSEAGPGPGAVADAGPASAAGSDAGHDPTDDVDPGVDEACFQCDPESALEEIGPAGSPWLAPKPLTQSQLMECQALCAEGDTDCYRAMCPNGDDFADCYSNELYHCASGNPDAPCSSAYVVLACCTGQNQCLYSQADFDACVAPDGLCHKPVQDYIACAKGNTDCQSAALSACVGP